ncbi:MAG: serine/threonine protein kinase [Candidatus Obscuribacterales bacterium]
MTSVAARSGSDITGDTRIFMVKFSDLIGRTVGNHYRIESLIGTGGYSAIFQATHLLLDRQVAIKVMSAPVTDSRRIERFEREAKLVSKLSHPNICGLFEFWFDDDGVPFLVMEKVNGLSLGQYLKEKGRLSLPHAASIAHGICQGLGFAHEKGIVHRDMKPENVMIASPDTDAELVKILDFGTAKSLHDRYMKKLTETGYVPGTPGFMSPEQCMGRDVDARSDIYSLTCMLYLMVAGREIFKHKSPIIMMKMHIQDEPDLSAPELPPELIPFLQLGFQKAPEDRFQSAAEFDEGLAQIVRSVHAS